MEKKTTAAYIALMSAWMEVCGRIEPVSVMADYEDALRAAVSETWPQVEVRGCLFHFGQAVLRMAVARKMVKCEQADAVQMAMSLPLLPPHKLQEGFAYVRQQLESTSAGIKFADYLDSQWSSKNVSVYGLSSRTNNFAESFHKTLKNIFKKPHPSPWQFIAKMQIINNDKSMDLRRLMRGTQIAPRKRLQEITKDAKVELAQREFEADGDLTKLLANTRWIMKGLYDRTLNVYTDVQYLESEDAGEMYVCSVI